MSSGAARAYGRATWSPTPVMTEPPEEWPTNTIGASQRSSSARRALASLSPDPEGIQLGSWKAALKTPARSSADMTRARASVDPQGGEIKRMAPLDHANLGRLYW